MQGRKIADSTSGQAALERSTQQLQMCYGDRDEQELSEQEGD